MKRPFLNLVLGSHKTGSFALRRIKTASFFHPKKQTGCPTPAAVELAELPEPTLSFGAPPCPEEEGRAGTGRMTMRFMPLGSNADKIVSTDQDGNVLLYDVCGNKVRSLSRLTGRMRSPIPIAAGDALYLIEACPRKTDPDQPHHCSFKALVHGEPPEGVRGSPGWHWHALPPPPYVQNPGYELKRGPSSGGCRIASWAVVGDTICISHDHESTCSFDTTSREWSHAGGWIRNMLGRAEHVPERDRLFGFRFVSSGDNQLFCASNPGKRPTLQDSDSVWEEEAPEDEPRGWSPDFARARGDWHSHHLVHLGSGRFCTARFYDRAGERFVVFAGVEVDRGLNMVKHKSLRYNLDDEPLQWVF
ncbi:hypothetical protein CFC21_053342 [Triticum aestivum]|uniref:Uncharacterized protein n=3 Tax=Triticum TaxID=4564 RepID=A0A9R0SIM9_TRITD|nr:hypothetical protein CFC21_053342 [Triticum aestivum]VAH94803.1 unnamed protein product [Triticum turgidum subsp. durum]